MQSASLGKSTEIALSRWSRRAAVHPRRLYASQTRRRTAEEQQDQSLCCMRRPVPLRRWMTTRKCSFSSPGAVAG